MQKKDIYENLCIRDKRNPCHNDIYLNGEEVEKDNNCSCDNCFYGRTKMAEYILELLC